MNALQFILITVGFTLISWVTSEGLVSREYLPPAVPVVAQRKIVHYPSYYKPLYNQYQQTYYPQYSSSYRPQHNNGFLGSYHQQSLGQQINTGTSLGPTAIGLTGYYPNVNFDLNTSIKPSVLKPTVDIIETIYDSNGGYVYGKKK